MIDLIFCLPRPMPWYFLYIHFPSPCIDLQVSKQKHTVCVCVGSIFHSSTLKPQFIHRRVRSFSSIFSHLDRPRRRICGRPEAHAGFTRNHRKNMRWSRWDEMENIWTYIQIWSSSKKTQYRVLYTYIYSIDMYWRSWPMFWQEAMVCGLLVKHQSTEYLQNHPEYDEQKDHSCGKCQRRTKASPKCSKSTSQSVSNQSSPTQYLHSTTSNTFVEVKFFYPNGSGVWHIYLYA